MFYVNVYEPTYEDMKKLNNTMFDDINMIDLERKYRHKILPETIPSFATHKTLPPPSPTSVNFPNTHSSRKQDPTSTIFPLSTNPPPTLPSIPYKPSITHSEPTSIPTRGFHQTISSIVSTIYHQPHNDNLYPSSTPTTNTF